MHSVLWGLIGALTIGVSDCIARVTAARLPTELIVLVVMLVSTIALSVGFAISGAWPGWHPAAWAYSAVSGVLNIVALQCLYIALRRGPVSIASPTASVFSVLIVGMNIVAGAAFTVWQLVSISLAFIAIISLSRPSGSAEADLDHDARWLRITALIALAAATAIALRFFLAQEASALVGSVEALYLNRLFALTAIIVFVLYRLRSVLPISYPGRRITVLLLIQAVLETVALGAFLTGSSGDGRVGAAIGFSAFAAVTVLCARVWLGEAVGWRRAIWIVVIGGAIVMAVLGSP